jgi:hypothetical protein
VTSRREAYAPLRGQLSRLLADLLPWWPPVLAWLAATSVVLATASHYGYPPFAPVTTWARHDAVQYLRIAHAGYHLTLCRLLHPPDWSAKWCGDAGWFPAYPWLIRGLHDLGLQYDATAIEISWLASLGTLVVLWRAFLFGHLGLGAAIALCYAAFAPGLVYNYAEFPLSLATFCTISCLALLQRRHWIWAGLAAGIAALAYPVGLAVAPACALWVLAEPGWRSIARTPARYLAAIGARLWHAVALIVPTLAAVALFGVVERQQTGKWNSYLLVQERFRHRLEDPFVRIVLVLRNFSHSVLVARPSYANLDRLSGAPTIEVLLVAFVIGCTIIELLVRRGPDTRDSALIAIWAILAWVLLWIETGVDTYRGDVALLPVAVLVRRLPWPLGVLVTAVAVLLVVPMTHLYLNRALI